MVASCLPTSSQVSYESDVRNRFRNGIVSVFGVDLQPKLSNFGVSQNNVSALIFPSLNRKLYNNTIHQYEVAMLF